MHKRITVGQDLQMSFFCEILAVDDALKEGSEGLIQRIKQYNLQSDKVKQLLEEQTKSSSKAL